VAAKRTDRRASSPAEPEFTIRELAEALRVPRSRLKRLEDLGLVEYERKAVHRGVGRVGHVSQFVDIPLYDCTEAGRVIGASGRTVRRWAKQGKVRRRPLEGYERLRITPREILRVKRERDARKRGRKLPSLFDLVARAWREGERRAKQS